MEYKTLMVIKSIVCLCFAPVLLFLPEQLLNLINMTSGSGTLLTAREYGAALAGNFLLAWYARNAEASSIRLAIILALFVYDFIALIATLLLQFSGLMNFLGWGIVFVYLFFTVGFGYLFFMERGLIDHQLKTGLTEKFNNLQHTA